jgi:hypothetical protein
MSIMAADAAVRSDRAMAEPHEIAPNVHMLTIAGSNVYFVRSGPEWVLIDTAWMNDGSPIRAAAEALYGAKAPRSAFAERIA